MFGERAIHEGVVRIEQREHGAIFLKQMSEKLHGFLLEVATHIHERGEVARTLFIQSLQIADMQPLTAKLGGQATDARIFHHATSLGGEHCGIMERALGRKLAEFFIGGRRPEEVTQSRGEFPIIHRRRLRSGGRFLPAIEERGSDQHAGEHHAHSHGVRQFLLAELFIKGAQIALLRNA